jgi:hypothetical protein
MRCQTVPQHYAPYMGQCSVAFLRPPQIDFTLRAMRAFDVMEVPLLAERLQSAFAKRVFAPMVWPRQIFFEWADLVNSPPPHRVHVDLVSLHPPNREDGVGAGAGGTSGDVASVFLAVSLSEKQYELHYTTADLRVPLDRRGSAGGGSIPVPIGEEPMLLLEAPHLLPRLRLELRRRNVINAAVSTVLCRKELPVKELNGQGVQQHLLGHGWCASLAIDVKAPVQQQQDERPPAVLRVQKVSMMPPSPADTRAAFLSLELRAGAWTAGTRLSADGEWLPDLSIPLPRPDAQPLHASVLIGEEVVGHARMPLDGLETRGGVAVLWGALEPHATQAVRIECELLDGSKAASLPIEGKR